jgi:hypothetical protein
MYGATFAAGTTTSVGSSFNVANNVTLTIFDGIIGGVTSVPWRSIQTRTLFNERAYAVALQCRPADPVRGPFFAE